MKNKRGRPRKYSEELVKKAIKMRKSGYSLESIKIELGFTNKASIWYHLTPGAKEKRKESTKKWCEKNREKWLQTMKRYNQIYRTKTKLCD